MRVKVSAYTSENGINSDFRVKDISQLDEILKSFMQASKVEKCKFTLEGEAFLKKEVQLDCLFG